MGISLLPQEIIEKISAGEVVTSPCAGIKELLENSLDANSKRIKIFISEKVIDKITIEDDGDGVEESELHLLCTRHATSKISKYQDMKTIKTLGFRGEALSSLSMVGKVRVYTGKNGDAWEAEYIGGKMIAKRRTEPRKGTKIEITDLFCEDPIKKDKFFYSKEENKKIGALLMKYSIAYEEVVFEIENAGKHLQHNRFTSSKLESISSLFSQKLRNELISIKIEEKNIKCIGYVTHSNISLPSPITMLFVNRRLVSLSKLKRRITEIYREILVKGHPFIYIEIEVPAEEVDVNVHPSKIEIHLEREEELISLLEKTIKDILENEKITGISKIGKMSINSNDLCITPKKKERTPQHSPIPPQKLYQPNQELPDISSQSPISSQSLSAILSTASSVTTSPYKKIRTDPQAIPLWVFLPKKSSQERSQESLLFSQKSIDLLKETEEPNSEASFSSILNSSPDPVPFTPTPTTSFQDSLRAHDTTENFLNTLFTDSLDAIENTVKASSLSGTVLIGAFSKHWMLIQKEESIFALHALPAAIEAFKKHIPSASSGLPLSIKIPPHLCSIYSNSLYFEALKKNRIQIEEEHIKYLPLPSFKYSSETISFSAASFSLYLEQVDVEKTKEFHENNPVLLTYMVLSEYAIQNFSFSLYLDLIHFPYDYSLSPIISLQELYQLFNR
ncbi:DNA mismatch repair protein MLH1 [Nematocida sp. LUAm3]|nr:DNA mismatch repair protein MLH1 [Nematocida sp. LUAm3]KAI5173735.1 DNA mismatch repair protein MLH1 [Nematocida sp. LUAm2]KAI5176958.1 DNA mismatch repair protein MLH1 [Nematocida sp. LUAm1]